MSSENVVMLAVDYDGCIFNKKYHEERRKLLQTDKKFSQISQEKERTSKAADPAISANKLFINHAIDKIRQHKAKHVVTTISSNRQSDADDQWNMEIFQTESCYRVHPKISDKLKKELSAANQTVNFVDDSFLLADINGGLTPGKSFEKATCNTVAREKHAHYLFDKTKMTIVYAQIHRWARQNKNAHLHYYFYEDTKYILESLYKFYSKNPQLVPKNVTLHFVCYSGENRKYERCHNGQIIREKVGKALGIDEVCELDAIDGAGKVDEDYYDSIKFLAKMIKEKQREGPYWFSEFLSRKKRIRSFLQHRRTRDAVVSDEEVISGQTHTRYPLLADSTRLIRLDELPRLAPIAIVEYDSLFMDVAHTQWNDALLRTLDSFDQVWIEDSDNNLNDDRFKKEYSFLEEKLNSKCKLVIHRKREYQVKKEVKQWVNEGVGEGSDCTDDSDTSDYADESDIDEEVSEIRGKVVIKEKKSLFSHIEGTVTETQIPIYTIIGSNKYLKEWNPGDSKSTDSPKIITQLEVDKNNKNESIKTDAYREQIDEKYRKIVVLDIQIKFVIQKLERLQERIISEAGFKEAFTEIDGKKEIQICEEWGFGKKLYARRYKAIENIIINIIKNKEDMTIKELQEMFDKLGNDENIKTHRNFVKRNLSFFFSPPKTCKKIEKYADGILEENLDIIECIKSAPAD